ncbi:hypothetical protein PIB30_001435 [Stylosanthes scabra]|uniref:Uncharacterized protein n=1 Tax=Stylosanthes scabra TaxID=79078 RepID=A0ABU6Z3D5_9FABA|nr:hypothetical protein [Stylosanthes scabra]
MEEGEKREEVEARLMEEGEKREEVEARFNERQKEMQETIGNQVQEAIQIALSQGTLHDDSYSNQVVYFGLDIVIE